MEKEEAEKVKKIKKRTKTHIARKRDVCIELCAVRAGSAENNGKRKGTLFSYRTVDTAG